MPIVIETDQHQIELPDTATQADIDAVVARVSQGVSQLPSDPVPAHKQPTESLLNAVDAVPPGIDPALAVGGPEETFEVGLGTPGAAGTGQAVGGIFGGLQGATTAGRLLRAAPPPIRGAGTILGGAVGAATGGSVGDLAQQGIQTAVGSELAPETLRESLTRAAQAGGEEAVIDAVGNLGFQVGGAIYNKFFRPVAKDTAADLVRILQSGDEPTHAAIDQIVDKGIMSQMSTLVRDALVGSRSYKELDAAQDANITAYLHDYVEQLAETGLSDLSPEATGRFLLDIIEQGRLLHSEAGGALYQSLGQVVPNPRVPVQIPPKPTGILGPNGQPIMSPARIEMQEVGAVDVSDLKRLAAERLDELNKAGRIGTAQEAVSELEKVISLEDRVSFKTAHDIRSGLLFAQRNLSRTKQDAPVASTLKKLESAVNDEMNKAGAKLDPNGLALYRQAQAFWREGKEDFYNNLLKTIIGRGDSPDKIGRALATIGNTDRATVLRTALRKQADLARKANVPGAEPFDKLWSRVQGGFLEQIVPASADELLKPANAFRRLHADKGMQRKLSGVFTQDQKENLVRLSRTIDTAIKDRQKKGFLNLRQLTAGGQLIGGGFAGYEGDLSTAAFFFFGPTVLAKVATSKHLTKAFYRWQQAPTGSALKVNAWSKLITALGIERQDAETIMRHGRNELIEQGAAEEEALLNESALQGIPEAP